MYTFFMIAAFLMMLLTPCLIAMCASMPEEGAELGYADALRRARVKLVDMLRV